MSVELVRTFAGRPTVVKDRDGWTVHLSVHDAEFLRQWRAWRQRLAGAHPDRGGTDAGFIAARTAYHEWAYKELRFYSDVGVDPPRQLPPDAVTRLGLTMLPCPDTVPCERCGREFVPRFSKASPTGQTRFCGRACAVVATSKRGQKRAAEAAA